MSMTRRAPARSATISEVGAIGVSPENAPCSLMSERATTHPLERLPVWPVLGRPRLAGFEVSTEEQRVALPWAEIHPGGSACRRTAACDRHGAWLQRREGDVLHP